MNILILIGLIAIISLVAFGFNLKPGIIKNNIHTNNENMENKNKSLSIGDGLRFGIGFTFGIITVCLMLGIICIFAGFSVVSLFSQ